MMNRLMEEAKKKEAPIVVGLDPNLSFLPSQILARAFSELGETLEGAARAIEDFNHAIIDAVYDLVPAVKPQIAMYEQYGIPGLMVYQRTVQYAKEKGLIVIGDIKRGDIGSTSEAYANAHIGKVSVGNQRISVFDEDIATVNPYLGTDGIRPFLKTAKEEGRGIFVLVKTSNPSSGEFQDRLIDHKPLYELVAEKTAEWGEEAGGKPYANVGAVVGATYPEVGKRIRELLPNTVLLIPGYGAQGGTGKDLKPYFDKDGSGVIVNSSRGIIAAFRNERYQSYGKTRFAEAARAAVLDMKEDLKEARA